MYVCMYVCVLSLAEKRVFFSCDFSLRPTLLTGVCILKLFSSYKTISHTIVVSRHLGSFFKLKKTSVVQFQNKRLSNILSFFRFSLVLSMCVYVMLFCSFPYFFLSFVYVIYFTLTLDACMCVKSAFNYYYSTLYHHSQQHHSVKVLAF